MKETNHVEILFDTINHLLKHVETLESENRFFSSKASNYEVENNYLIEENESLRAENEQLKSAFDIKTNYANNVGKELAELQKKHTELKGMYVDLNAEHEELKAEYETIEEWFCEFNETAGM